MRKPPSAGLRKGRQESFHLPWMEGYSGEISKAFLLNTTCLDLQPLYELTKMRSNDGFLCSGSHERDFVFSFQELNLRRLSALFLTSFVQWALLISEHSKCSWLLTGTPKGRFPWERSKRDSSCLPAAEVTHKWFQSFPPETWWLKVIKNGIDNLVCVLWLFNDGSMNLERSVTFKFWFYLLMCHPSTFRS